MRHLRICEQCSMFKKQVVSQDLPELLGCGLASSLAPQRHDCDEPFMEREDFAKQYVPFNCPEWSMHRCLSIESRYKGR